MTDWNRDYLSAMGVPLWVPRQSQLVEKKEESSQHQQLPDGEQASKEALNQVLSMVAISGKQEQPFAIIIDEKANINQAKQAFQQLQYAWQQWTDSELPVTLFQLSQQPSEQRSESAVSMDEFNGKLMVSANFAEQLCVEPNDKLMLVPELLVMENTHQHRKKWWETLQQIDEQVRH